jgi:4-amino-4-deoxy-L-arabinose transferase-like glycosyltransferase
VFAKNFSRFWFVTLLLKLLLAAVLPLSADEAYYWVWSKHLQLSYFDHPPLVSWLLALGSPFELIGNAVRWPGVILGHLTLLFWFLILRSRLKEEELHTWLLLVILSPVLGIGSILLTPDLPLIAFWSMSLFLFLRALESPKKTNYLLFGSALGLGFLSKYHIVIFLFAAISFLIAHKKLNQVRWSYLVYTFIGGLFFSIPVLVWNSQNEWSSFRFQLNHGLAGGKWEPYWSYSYILGQILTIFPVIFYWAARAKPNQEQTFLRHFSWIPLIFFLLTSFKAKVEINWPMMAYPAITALAVIATASLKNLARVTIAFWLLLYSLIVVQIQLDTFSGAPRKIKEPYLYDSVIANLDRYQPAYANTYQMASAVWYKTKKPFYKLREMSRVDFFDTFSQANPTESKFYLFRKDYDLIPKWLLDGYDIKVIDKVGNEFEVLEFNKKAGAF